MSFEKWLELILPHHTLHKSHGALMIFGQALIVVVAFDIDINKNGDELSEMNPCINAHTPSITNLPRALMDSGDQISLP